MIKTSSVIPDFPDFHEFYGYAPEKTLFFDIETTGLSRKSSCVFLIGTIHLENNIWQLTQYLAEHASEEKLLLETFFADAALFDTLIHFNGSTFDLPFLNSKAESYHLEGFSAHSLSGKASIDLYRILSILRYLPEQTSLKQPALEKLAGWQRTDTLTGKHMIAMFRSFDKTQDTELLHLMMLHNHDDLIGMTKLLPLAAYCMLAGGNFSGVVSCSLSQDSNCTPLLQIELSLLAPLPAPLSLSLSCAAAPFFGACVCTLFVKNSTATLSFYGVSCELKYFFPDHKNYYFLPLEDQAVHKSVASYIDKEYRIPAKAATCYTRKNGIFFWQPKPLLQPSFRASLDSTADCFCLNEKFSHQTEEFSSFLSHILRCFF